MIPQLPAGAAKPASGPAAQASAAQAAASGAAAPRPASAPAAAAAPKKPGLAARALGVLASGIHDACLHVPLLNRALGVVAGPFIKQRFNPAPKPDQVQTWPDAFTPEEVRGLEAKMAQSFKPQEGKVLVALCGGGKETVHAFVVSGVTPDGHVKITQALAQTNGKPEDYSGVSGFIRKFLDRKLGNSPEQMTGVVEEDFASYALRAKRNTFVLLELDADPAEAQKALQELKGLVGKPYDRTLMSGAKATKASQQEMYCTEISSWFVNRLKPGTIQQSRMYGYPLYQVADHMRATTLHGGPLKVLANAGNRLDLEAVDPFPKRAA